MDNGHYHPTEVVSDKLSALLCYFPEIALHITRGVRWDSDHVLLFDDETKEMAKEIVRCDALDRVYMALDFFDASINRVAAWTVGVRSWQKALLNALLTPHAQMKRLQDEGRFGELMVLSEEQKTLPFGIVWEEYLTRCGVPSGEWYAQVEAYEKQVLSTRQKGE
jgi:L-rhamnose isomerase